MLQNQPQTEQLVAPGQVRITPEELRQAVAAIERRKEAVSHLHLDATPEVIWGGGPGSEERSRSAPQAAVTPSAVTQVPFGPPHAQLQAAPSSHRTRGRWRGIFVIGAGLWFLHVLSIGPRFVSASSPATPALAATVAQIADGKEFYCDNSGLAQLSEGKNLPQIHVDATRRFGNSWTLVKMAGHVYLRAYTRPISLGPVLSGKPLGLYNDDNSGELEGHATAQTTVRMDNVLLQLSGGDDDYSQITLPHFQSDQFTTTSPWR